MKYRISLLGTGLLLCHTLAFGQSGKLEFIRSTDVSVKEVSDTLQVEMKLLVGKVDLRGMEQITVTPKLIGETGEHHDFTSFVVAGKTKQRYLLRSALLNKQQLPGSRNEYTYSERVPFVEWMQDAKLVLDGRTSVCGCDAAGVSIKTLADSVVLEPKLPLHRYVMKPAVNFVMPEAEPIKNRAEVGSAKIEFLSGKSNIMPTYKSNQVELDKINNAIKQVLNDTLAKVHSIVLTAYASPEGSYAANEKLSLTRALALKAFVESSNDLKGVTLATKAVGEDWKGLEQLILQSDLAQKQPLLDIIAKNSNPDRREQLMKQLAGGKPWRTMLTEWFPQLRRTDYQLDYSVKSFTVEQGRSIIKTRPAQMSLNEMFHVANSYPKGSADFNEVFDIAVRLFPNDSVANTNAAAAAIAQGDSIAALKYLERVKEYPQATNNWAAYYLLTNEIEKAKLFLEKAPQAAEATLKNREEIKIKEQENALFLKYEKR